jgi:hypothetical protein
MRIVNAQPPLLGTIDEEQSAERPECLTAQILRAFLIDDDDTLAGIGDLGSRD